SFGCSTTTSKLNVLVNKLHEYLAHSMHEDSNGSADSDGEITTHSSFDIFSIQYSLLSVLPVKSNNTVYLIGAEEIQLDKCKRFVLSFVMLQFNDLIAMICPGTVLVRPEPVDNGRDDFRGPEFRSRKSNVLRKEFSRRRGGQSRSGGHKVATNVATTTQALSSANHI
uniref:Uncharacterized protein n=1 Tax=Hippocampus comes TaxID=109280 RepID=A0A3Q2XKQ3_HIPCM